MAVFSVLPPTRSGVATYTHRLIAALANHVDVTCFYAGDEPVGTYAANVAIRETRSFDATREHGSFDALVYCLGNNPVHASHVELALTCPDVVLLHEPKLVNARSGVEASRLDPFLCADVCRAARLVCVHSQAAAGIVLEHSSRRATMVGPLAVPEATSRPTEPRMLVSAGIVAMVKQADLLVEAFGIVAERMPDMRLAFVGPCGPDERRALIRIAADRGCASRLLITGELSNSDYAALVGSASVAIQLRATSHGESSAAVTDAIAAGVPTIVSDIGSFSELPDEVVAKVSPTVSPSELADLMVSVSTDAQRRAMLISSANSYAAEHSFESAARRLVAAVLA